MERFKTTVGGPLGRAELVLDKVEPQGSDIVIRYHPRGAEQGVP
jgi:hypothetical protein